MIRQFQDEDLEAVHEVVNDAAAAYRGVIPDDRWREPYMPLEELRAEIAAGVRFSVLVEDGVVVGCMGLQNVRDVVLLRHAYVRTSRRRAGIGRRLLEQVCRDVERPILVGTWKAAGWAIEFYRKNGFREVDEVEKNRLLRTYWSIPERQVATSTVLARLRRAPSRPGSGGDAAA